MNTKRPFAPKFLNKLDDHLLLHKPETWSARTHLVLYYGLLFIALLAGLCFIIPNDARSNSPVAYWIGFLVVIGIIAIVGWMIFLLRFNVFKRFGNITAIGRLKTFFLYFVSVGTIVLFTYVPSAVESFRANMAYSDNEIFRDINSINTKICQLEYDSLKHNWNADTILVVDKIQTEPTVYSGDTLIPVTHPVFRVMDTADFAKKKKELDSIVKIADSTYVLYECPEYVFLKPYTSYSVNMRYLNYDNNIKSENVMTSVNIFDSVIRNYKVPDKQAISKELFALIKKYSYDHYNSRYGYYEGDYDVSSNLSFWQKTEKKYSIRNITRSMENILERKHRWDKDSLPWQIRLFIYFTFIITLLVFIFRHSTVKTFFLSLLTGIIFTILSGLTLAFSHSDESLAMIWVIFYTTLFGVLSFTVFASRIRTLVSGISINLFVLLITFLPLTIVSYYYEKLRQESYNDITNTIPPINYEAMYRHLFYAEITGFVMLIILLPTLIHKLYRRWYSLPQE